MLKISEQNGKKKLNITFNFTINLPKIKFPSIKIPKIDWSKIKFPQFPKLWVGIVVVAIIIAALYGVGIIGFATITSFLNVGTVVKSDSASAKSAPSAPASASKGPSKTDQSTSVADNSAALKISSDAKLKIAAGNFVFELTHGAKREEWRSLPIAHEQVAEGKKGNYFYITLLDVVTKQPFYFNRGEYTFDELDPRFSAALLKFQNEVMNNLAIAKPIIYIKGSADSLSPNFASKFEAFNCDNGQSNEINFHKRVQNAAYRFENAFTKRSVGEIYGNNDLPFLRARFLQCKYNLLFPKATVEILEGDIDANVDVESRNGTFILYVPFIEPDGKQP